MNRRNKGYIKGLILISGIGVCMILFIHWLKDKPEEVVEQFYQYESEAAFAKSWEIAI